MPTKTTPAQPVEAGRPKGRRAGRSQTAVLEAAARIIAERGAHATRFADVASATNVPVSSLQYYFGSRDDMVIAAFRHAAKNELSRLTAELATIDDPWHRLERIVEVALAGFDDNSHTGVLWIESWRFALRDVEVRSEVLADYESWRSLIASAVSAGVEAGHFTSDLEAAHVARQLLALLDGMVMPAALSDSDSEYDSGRLLVLDALSRIIGRKPQTQ
jgi:AcrR family transcriptional regulator